MKSAHRPHARRSLLAAAAVAAALLTVPGVAAAEDGPAGGDTIVGEFVQVWQEHEDAETAVQRADGSLLSFVRTGSDGTVRLATGDVEELPVGATVEVTVGQAVADDAAAEEGLAPAREVLAAEVLEAAPQPTAGGFASPDHAVTVVMVVPAGEVQDGTTLPDVVAAVDGPVSDFWWEQARLRIGVVGSHDWISTTADCSDPFLLWDEVATRVGFTPGLGQHLLLYVADDPANPSCSYGLGTVGSVLSDGGYSYVRSTGTSLIAHELGHNFGLGHSSARQCDRAVETGTCQTVPYADYYDVMGYSWENLGSLSMAQAWQLNKVPTWDMRQIHPSSPSETVTLVPVSQLSGMRGILLWGGPGRIYWLEYRAASGRDAWIPGAGLQTGVQIRYIPGQGDDFSLLLDGTPGSPAQWAGDVQTALPLNTPVRLAGGDFTVTVTSASAAGATVRVTTPAPVTPVAAAYAAAGAETGVLGPATSAETCSLPGSGQVCWRLYERGAIYWSAATGAHPVHGGLYTPWVASGGKDRWGLPTSGTVCGLVGGGCSQDFTTPSRTSLYWSPDTGLVGVSGAINASYQAVKAQNGSLGYPVEAMGCTADSCSQRFEGGRVVWSTLTGTHTVTAPLADAWVAAGAGTGPLRFPVRSSQCGLVRGGCGQLFQGGSMYWSPATGAHPMFGAIRQHWAAQRWELGPLGYPVEAMGCTADSCNQRFEGGRVVWSAATGIHTVTAPVADAWVAAGAATSPLGYPMRGSQCGLVRGGCGQLFQGGSMYWSPATGAYPMFGAIRQHWAAQRWEVGPLGYPVEAMGCTADSCSQRFEGGRVVWSAATGIHTVTAPVADAWVAAGAGTGSLGYPVRSSQCGMVRGGCGQLFQGGSMYWSPATGAFPIVGAIRQHWAAQRWELGPLGYPVEAMSCTTDSCSQRFEGGRVVWSAGAGTRTV